MRARCMLSCLERNYSGSRCHIDFVSIFFIIFLNIQWKKYFFLYKYEVEMVSYEQIGIYWCSRWLHHEIRNWNWSKSNKKLKKVKKCFLQKHFVCNKWSKWTFGNDQPVHDFNYLPTKRNINKKLPNDTIICLSPREPKNI